MFELRIVASKLLSYHFWKAISRHLREQVKLSKAKQDRFIVTLTSTPLSLFCQLEIEQYMSYDMTVNFFDFKIKVCKELSTHAINNKLAAYYFV